MSTKHLLKGDGGAAWCGASSLDDGSNVTSDRDLFSCEECGQALDQRWTEVREEMMDKVLEYGHQVVGVFDNDDPAGYLSYSAGRCVLGKPEFITTGALPLPVSGFMINEAAQHMDDGDLPVADGYEFLPDTLLSGYGVRVVKVDPEQYPINTVWNLFGHDPSLELLQLLWPDMDGHFPDDPAYTGPPQPLHPLEGSTA